MFTTDQLKNIVLSGKVLNEQEFELFRTEAERDQQSLEEVLIARKAVTETQLYTIAARVFGVPFLDVGGLSIPDALLLRLPEATATAYHVIPVGEEHGTLRCATATPIDAATKQRIEEAVHGPVTFVLTNPSSLRTALRHYHRAVHVSPTPTSDTHPAVGQVETMLARAVEERASDIHIEPTASDVVVRFRVDGLLRVALRFPVESLPGIVARIKVLANLKIDEHRLPQDGRFTIASATGTLSVRVSIVPVVAGENVVMRLLDETAEGVHSLEELGLSGAVKASVERAMRRPHGILLVTGPTGSGKTTTLYTMLRLLNRPEVNIVTIEDPIEYRLLGINQTQVNPAIGLTFAQGLRAFLRQDPDIMMVGEIRDEETANVAVHASLTGHLVLSTLHTNDAVSTLARLVDMGIQSYLLAQTLTLVIAQRLVRTVCPSCVASYTMDAETKAALERLTKLDTLREAMQATGVLAPSVSSLDNVRLYKGKGCATCGRTGYKGRCGIYEVLPMTQALSDLVSKRADRDALQYEAERGGLVTLLADGLAKALKGVTTIEEVLRVTAVE